jgi:arylamine N-acetyltransferase
MNNAKKQQYLERLHLSEVDKTYVGLKVLQEQHMKHIPFENLDVVVGRDILLAPEHLFNKIVEGKRGGYCFELNLLYASLLRSLGFEPKPVMGRVWLRNPKKMPPRNHLAHLLELEGKTYVTDVGFGALAPRVPLDINSNREVEDGDGMVRIINIETSQYMVQRKVGHLWENQYSFEDVEVSDDDVQIASFYMSKSEHSHFCKDRFVGIFTDDGRIGLFENKLTRRVGINTVESSEISTRERWLACLQTTFNLELDFSENELTALFSRM